MAKINDLLQENEKLRREIAEMVSLLKENETLAENFKKIQYDLLLCDSFDEISEKPLKYAEKIFDLERVALFVRDEFFSFTADDHKENERVFIASPEAFKYTFLEMRPFYGKEPVIIHEKFRVYRGEGGYSFVVVPIVLGDKIGGALGFYSANEERFDKEQNFDFLNELSFVAGICLKRLEDANTIEKRAQNDYLTGLPNKSVMDIAVLRWIERYKDFGTTFSFILLNIDNLSYVNETLGHKVGDDVLKRVGKAILHIVGENGTLGRFSGDEFYLFLNADDEDKLTAILDDIAREVAEIGESLDIAGKMSVSGGGVRIPHDLRKAANLEELLKLVFLRLAKSKKESGGTFIGV